MSMTHDPADLLAAAEAMNRHGSKAAAARALGISRSTFCSRLEKATQDGTYVEPDADDGVIAEVTDVVDGESRVLMSKRADITTPEELMAHCGIDPDEWQIVTCKTGHHQVPVKVRSEQAGPDPQHPDWKMSYKKLGLVSVKITLKRTVPERVDRALSLIAKRLQDYRPTYRPIRRTKRIDPPHMLEVSVYDTHLGKLAWKPETGTDYDLKIAECGYINAIRDLVERAAHYNIEKILLPIGQDFYHVDNLLGETANGTPQDTDGRYVKMFEAGYMVCVQAIDHLRAVAPVRVCWVPGNHDKTTSWHLAHALSVHYRDAVDVDVDCSPTHRKYEMYGTTLLGYTHGNEEKHADLPLIMAGDRPDDWAKSTHREIHLGHLHKRKETRHTAGDSFGPVVVRILPSLSGTDAWHYRKGYVNGPRAAEAYLWSRDDGYAGHLSVNFRAGDLN